jgi:hypothetical protein
MAEDDVAVLAIWADRAGTDWVVKYLTEHKDSIDAIVVRAEVNAPVASLMDEIKDIGPPVVEWKGVDYNIAHALMFDRLRDNKIRHLPHDGLDMAATSAVENLKSQGGWTVDIRKSPTDVSPLLAAMGAVWGLTQVDNLEYNVLESVW